MLKRLAIALVGFCVLPFIPASAQTAPDYFLTTFGKVGGIKVCSAVEGGNWRNDLIVPQSWTPTDCKAWATTFQGASALNLGCLGDHSVEYDFSPGWNNSCGW
jgi:hypothetical protein